MEDTRIDRLEVRQDQLAAEMRNGFRAVDARLCKIEALPDRIDLRLDQIDARLDQTATKADLRAIEMRLDQTATKAELSAIEARLEARLDQTATKAGLIEGLSNLRVEILSANAEMKRWMLATTITIIATFLVAPFGLHHWHG